jgi:Ni/Co efflux regulator RcnB
MRNRIVKTVALAALAVLGAGTADAQGRGNGRRDRDDDRRGVWSHDRDRDRDRDYYDRGYRRVPPGLAKKPGHMPPGQFKKRYDNRYSTYHGASVLSDILRRRGYQVVRVAPYGNSQYVYYRPYRGAERRAMVYPGGERLGFSNVPGSLLQAVLAQLY